jgi:uncharacterized membrane protein (Fun14 family)
MSVDTFTSIPATIGGGFFGGATSWLCIKEDSQAIAIIVGLFIAGLAYLQYQNVASFDWNRIEGIAATMLGNITNQVASNLVVTVLGMSTLGIPLTGNMTAGFAVGFMRGL